MTRKEYVHKMQALVLAMRNHPESRYAGGYKVGNALRNVRNASDKAVRLFGSYQGAWDSVWIKWARAHYLEANEWR